jgi:WD40 repeat protein
MAELPIVVLAFANEQEGRRYLRDLPEELRTLQSILEEAERKGLCRIKLFPNATLEQIFEVFTRNRDRVAIFHYGGHADSGRLLLESGFAGGAPAHAAGLATFLGQCSGLQLVFLNGCSTRAQVAGLLEAGVAAVIATARAIDDGVARAFAIAFYTELTSGVPLRAAFEKARGRVQAVRGEAPKAYYQSRDLGALVDDADSPDPADVHGFPWEFCPGSDLVKIWSLPDAAGNPEFGLPRPPEGVLPTRPFRHLNWFTAEHAEVFFGRGYQVRELYDLVIDPAGSPIVLLYGASGVGKSSLLEAGVMPRLAAGGHSVRYCRRDEKKGLLGTLRDALQVAEEPATLAEGWRAQEARLEKPLVVFLDQVEEVFTRPDPDQPHELDEFLDGLVAVLGKREARPRGELVLGFRKEWLADLDRRLAEAKLDWAPFFLKPLDRRGIIEAIRGPARPGRLQRRYQLVIEDGLPEVIAEDLLADAGSALSSTLQVLLDKMWERARQANPDQPRFDRALYESLRAEGYLLDDVLDEGLEGIGRWSPAVKESGLVLDLLAFHTTEFGTAAQRTRAEIGRQYVHQADVLDGLLGRCKDHYLLIEAEPLPGGVDRPTRLAHDLLAPLVQQRFRVSMASGQRARRQLENRAPEWQDGRTGPVLDSADLAIVEAGAAGMRVWTADETRLVEASRRAEEQRTAQEQERARRLQEAEERQRQAEAERQRETEQRLKDQEAANRRLRKRAILLGLTLVVMVGVAIFAGLQYQDAQNDLSIAEVQKKKAEEATAKEVVAAKNARNQAQRAEQSLRIANAERLAACAHDAMPERPQQSLLLAVEAIRATRDRGEPIVVAAEQALHDALSSVHSRPLIISPTNPVRGIALAGDDRLITGGAGGMEVWDLKNPKAPPVALRGYEGTIQAWAVAPDGRLITSSTDQSVRVWDLTRPTTPPLVIRSQEGPIQALGPAPDGRLAAGGPEGMVQVWDLKQPGNPPRVLTHPRGRTANLVGFIALALASEGRLIALDMVGTAWLWDLVHPADRPRDLSGAPGMTTAVGFAPDGRPITAGYDGAVRLWDLKDPAEQPLTLPGHQGSVSVLGVLPDGRLVSGGSDGTVRVRDLKHLSDQPLVLVGHDSPIRALGFPSDGRLITFGGDGTARASDLKHPAEQPLVLTGHEGRILGLGFAPDGRLVTTGGDDGTVRVWDLKDPDQNPRLSADTGTGSSDRTGISCLAIGLDGTFATLDWNGQALVWDLTHPAEQPWPLTGHQGRIRALVFAPDGRLVTGAVDGTVQVWDLKHRADQPLSFPGHKAPILALSATLNGWLITLGVDGTVQAFDLKHPADQLLTLPGNTGRISDPTLAFDGQLVVAAGGDGMVRVWDLKHSSDPPRVLAHPRRGTSGRVGIDSLALMPGGRLIAGGVDGTVWVWDLQHPANQPQALLGHKGLIDALARAPDGRLITGGFDFTARVWDLNDGTAQPIVLRGHQGSVHNLDFAPDGRLVTGSLDGTARVWVIDRDELIKRAEQVAGRNLTHAEWQQFFGSELYRRTFPNLPDGTGVAEARHAQESTSSRPPTKSGTEKAPR